MKINDYNNNKQQEQEFENIVNYSKVNNNY